LEGKNTPSLAENKLFGELNSIPGCFNCEGMFEQRKACHDQQPDITPLQGSDIFCIRIYAGFHPALIHDGPSGLQYLRWDSTLR